MFRKYFLYILVFVSLSMIQILAMDIFEHLVMFQQISKAIFILIGAYCVAKTLLKSNRFKSFQKLLLSFNLLLLATSLFSNHTNQIFSCTFVLLSYFVSYYLSSSGKFNKNQWLLLFVVLSCIILYDFYTQISYMIAFRGLDLMGGQNISYSVVGIMLLCLIFIKDVRFIIIMCVYFVCVLFCFKKGAVVCGGAALAMVLLYHIRDYKKYRCFIYLILGLGVIYLLKYSDLIFRRFFDYADNAGMNGRDIIYSTILNEWLGGSIIKFLIGGGFFHAADINYFGSPNNTGFYAHSDIYEVIADYGLLGIIFYTVILFNAYKSSKIVRHTSYKYMLYALLSVWVTKAYFSGVYTTINSYLILLTFGYIHGRDTYEKEIG